MSKPSSPHTSHTSLRASSSSLTNLSSASASHASILSIPTTRLSQSNLSNDKSRKSENVTVSVRVRPLSDNEQREHEQHIWDCVPGHAGRILLADQWRERLRKQNTTVEYQYDQVFVGSSNDDIYLGSVRDVVRSSMEGFNATVFAYGQTSSGKTYSMMGSDGNPGIIPQAIEDVFEYISETREQREFLLRVSYLEIYNETIRDLLSPDNVDLKIHEDRHRGVYVSPLKEEIVTNASHVMKLIALGEESRHVSSTDYNERSSRSHTVFQIVIESRERVPGSPAMSHLNKYRSGVVKSSVPVRISCLNLIDLAGSEKASSSLDRRREGAYINKSLLTLGTVISKLTEDKAGHVPFRDSKLTRILQPSLQGNARVSVICTVSPALSNFEESHNTLKFAQRIKKVVTRAQTTEIMDDRALLQKYKNQIEELRQKLNELSEREAETTTLAAEKMRLEEELAQQDQIRVALVDRIDQLTKHILTSGVTPQPPFANNRRSFNSATSPVSPGENHRLSAEVKSIKSQLEMKQEEIDHYKEELAARETRIVELEFDLNTLKDQFEALKKSSENTISNSDLLLALRKELLEAQEANKKLQQKLSEKEAETCDVSKLRDRINELELELASKEPSFENISDVSPPPQFEQSNNAKLLADLVQKTPPMSNRGAKVVSDPPPTPPQIRSNERIAELDTELTIAKAEMTASALLNSYSKEKTKDKNTTRTSSLEELDEFLRTLRK